MPGHFSWTGWGAMPVFPGGRSPSDDVLQRALETLKASMAPPNSSSFDGEGIVHASFSAATFEAAIVAAVDALLAEQSAALVQADGGDMAGRMFAVIDGDGDGQYQSAHDFVLELFSPGTPLDPGATCIA